jgi:hypothetical protein
MKHHRPPLGDSHNFGRRVTLHARRVHKPRTLLWEWLLLARESPLRQLLNESAAAQGFEAGAFEFLPALRFYGESARDGGEVERVALQPLPALSREQKRQLAGIVGRSLALFSFLGVSDLHWENLVLGAGARGRIVFGPLDIEMVLADLALPTETKLLPDADPEYAAVCRHACGVRRVLPYLGKPIAAEQLLVMAGAYHATLALLDRNARAIADVFAALPNLRKTPIRVCLRGTDEYVRADPNLFPPLLDAELEQLARGDIPYFFRLYGRPGIHYFGDETLSDVRRLPLHGDVPKLDPILSLSRGLASPSRKRLREDGLFALVGAFDHAALSGKYREGELEARFSGRSLVIRLPNGDELETRRNLRAFVESVYLPCRCGEVRSVFVPKVTRCTLARRRGPAAKLRRS